MTLELFGDEPFSLLLVGAVGAALEVRGQGRRLGGIEVAALILDEVEPSGRAVHRSSHLA
jgi:hypothetical protein